MKFQSKKNSRRTSCPVQTALFTPALLRGRPAAPCTGPDLASLITTSCPRLRLRTPHSRIITSPEWTRITIISERCFLHSTISSQSQSRRSHDWAGASSFPVSPPQSWVRLTARSLRTPASARRTASTWPPWPGPRVQPPGSGATQAAAGARHTRAHAAPARVSPDQRYAAASRCPKRSSIAREIKVNQQNNKLISLKNKDNASISRILYCIFFIKSWFQQTYVKDREHRAWTTPSWSSGKLYRLSHQTSCQNEKHWS